MIFEPLAPEYTLMRSLAEWVGAKTWRLQHWNDPWDAKAHFGTLTFWFPPPEIARQGLNFFMNTWVEQPLVTSGLFIVPRVVPAFWHGLSRYIVELPTIRPEDPWLPLYQPPVLPIPIVLLYIAPHTRTVPTLADTSRLGTPADAATIRWHQDQAENMRGLS